MEDTRSDAELLSSVRSGDPAAYGVLFARHSAAVTAVARYHSKDSFAADDLTAEAFERTYTTIMAGGGPDVSFRAYVYTAVRRLAYEQTEKSAKTVTTDDFTAFEMPDEVLDPAVNSFEKRVVSDAFASLPERWQAVLWYLEVEGMTPPAVAPLLGLTANGVSALAYRAREGLRQAYLQQHVMASPDRLDCEEFRGKLGAYSRGSLAKRETAQVDAHLDHCDECPAILAELQDVGHGMRIIIAPLILGGAAAAGIIGSGIFEGGAATAATIAPPPAPRGIGHGVRATAIAGAIVAAIAVVGISGTIVVNSLITPSETEAVPPAVSEPASTPKPTRTPVPAPVQTVSPIDSKDDAVAKPRTPVRPVRPVVPTTPVVPVVNPEIAVQVDDLGDLVLGREGMVGATISNVGTVPVPATSVTISLPQGVAVDAIRNITSSGDGSVSCLPTAAGASCTLSGLVLGGKVSIFLPVVTGEGADQSVRVSVSAQTAGLTPVTASASATVTGSGVGARFVTDGPVDVARVGGSFLSCDAAVLGCDKARLREDVGDPSKWNNNAWDMQQQDPEGHGTNSSKTNLILPSGSTVLFAGLYWAGHSSSTDPVDALGRIELRPPGGSYQQVLASRVDRTSDVVDPEYQAFADVTALVQSGGAGDWTAAGARVLAGSTDLYGGWSLVVAYSDPTLAPGRVAIFDGFQAVQPNQSVSFNVAGEADTSATVGIVAWEGDAGTTGDSISFDGAVLTPHAPAPNNDPNNAFDSYADGFGPTNTFGIDVKSFLPVSMANTRARVSLSTTGDAYSIAVVTVVTR